MSSSAKSLASVELPKDKHKHTAVQQSAIKQKLLGGGVRDLSKTGNPSALEDAEDEVLEKRRDELQKELEKQLKMESQAKKSSKEMLKKHKKLSRPSTSSDSSSSSDSGSSSRKNSSSDDSSTSSSSTSRESRKKMLKKNIKRRRPSSSSSDDHPPLKKKLTSRKHGSHKKSVVKIHAKKALAKGHTSRAITPMSMGRKRSVSPLKVGQKLLSKQKSISKEKHHTSLVKDRSRDTKDRELLRDKEKVRLHKERVRSRTPVKARVKSRSPRRSPQRSRELKRKSHEKRLSPSKVRTAIRRDRSVDRVKGALKEIPRRHESSTVLKERERRDKERADREAARNKERAEALARCQERQRERERLAKEKELAERDKTDRGKIVDRLLPRPAERAMALAASRGESHDKMDRERPRSHSQSNVRRYHDSPLRRDREERHGERSREHEYVIVRNRSDTRSSLTYDGPRRSTREDHEYGEVPMEPRYESHDDRHLSHEYTRAQYGNERIHREHEWDQGRERMYERQDLNRAPVQNEWERNDMAMATTMTRSNDPYAETGEWNVAERQWDESGGGKPAGSWQGGMKEESWEGGYQERDTWMERHREVPDGRRWPSRRPGHQMMSSGDGEGRPEPYRRPAMAHPHPHIQADHMNPMGGNASGVYHHNQGMRHIPPPLSVSADLNVSMGKEYGNQSAATTHFSVNAGMPQTPQKRPRLGEDSAMSGMSDSNTPSLDLAIRKTVKSNTSEEAIEDNLSEISDDADEILNSVENVSEQKEGDNVEGVDAKKSDGVKNSQEATDENKDDVGEKSIKDIHDDFNLGFEEISDGELEEEARVKGLGDALGVDWTSLVTESRARDEANRSEPTSVRQKWKHHQVLLNLGISVKMAGEEFTRELLKRARAAAKEDEQGGVAESDEAGENEANSDIISHVADVQVAQRRATERRARLISQASGCFSRALNARRDLQIRRQLCGFPIQEVHYCSVSPELNNLAVQLFKKATSLTM